MKKWLSARPKTSGIRPQPPFQIPDLKALQVNVWSVLFCSAVQAVIRPGEFGKVLAAFEFGCDTGRQAEILLENHLPANARYVGMDSMQTLLQSIRYDNYGHTL